MFFKLPLKKRTVASLRLFHAFAWEQIQPGHSVLDYGCNDGKTLASLRHDGKALRVGVDLCGDAVEAGRQKFPKLRLDCITKGQRLSFADGTFDYVLILDVIEHIFDQALILRELRRVMKPDGRLVISVPRRHLFSCLDLGNWKFYFPRTRRWWHVRHIGQAEYERRFGNANPFGLIGDIEKEKGIHEHFSRKSLTALLSKTGFQPLAFDGTGLFQRVYAITQRLLPTPRFWLAVFRLDARLFARTNLFCTAGPMNR